MNRHLLGLLTVLSLLYEGVAAARAADPQSSTVICVAGCRTATPQVVQHIKHVVSAGPKPKKTHLTEVMLGVWCGDRGHCLGWPTHAPHATTIQYSPHQISIWSR